MVPERSRTRKSLRKGLTNFLSSSKTVFYLKEAATRWWNEKNFIKSLRGCHQGLVRGYNSKKMPTTWQKVCLTSKYPKSLKQRSILKRLRPGE
jgi:hypothetical protein